MSEAEELLTEGLMAGYAGTTGRETIERGPFVLETTHLESDQGVYRDEWIANRSGGGQEIVITSSQDTNLLATRLYAGGTISREKLAELGLTKKDVTNYLKKKLKELGSKTRLHNDCNPESDGEWIYSYSVFLNNPQIPLTMALEAIDYQDVTVFEHGFLLTSIDK